MGSGNTVTREFGDLNKWRVQTLKGRFNVYAGLETYTTFL